MTLRHTARVAVTIAFVPLLAAGCVNHAKSSARFCERNAELLDEVQDGQRLSEDQAVFVDDELQKTMRYSEDGSRDVRGKARNLSDAYADIREIAGDDGVEEKELEEKYAELQESRQEMRAECTEVEQA